jgi:hypothetical protein
LFFAFHYPSVGRPQDGPAALGGGSGGAIPVTSVETPTVAAECWFASPSPFLLLLLDKRLSLAQLTP